MSSGEKTDTIYPSCEDLTLNGMSFDLRAKISISRKNVPTAVIEELELVEVVFNKHFVSFGQCNMVPLKLEAEMNFDKVPCFRWAFLFWGSVEQNCHTLLSHLMRSLYIRL